MTWISDALQDLDAAMAGDSAPLEFLPAEPGRAPRWVQRPDALSADSRGGPDSSSSAPTGERAAVVVRTSGSTGTPKQTLLPESALRASAEMTAEALGGHGQWLLVLQPSYVAGLAVLTRSLAARTTPVALLEDTTDPARFTATAEQLTAARRYVSLVPTQLQRLLEHTDDDARLLAALQRFDAILLGGGPTSPASFDAARRADLRVVRTYGMSETCGGCLYDGHPLPGVRVDTDDDGRVHLSGPMVASGYLGDPDLTAAAFGTDPATGHRRFRTDDLGEIRQVRPEEVTSLAVVPAGRDGTVPKVQVTGRADDVIITGGVKVSAEKIRQLIEADPEVAEAFVAGIEDPEWGQSVAAAVVLQNAPAGDFAPLPEEAEGRRRLEEAPEYPPREWHRRLRDQLRSTLGAAAVPKRMLFPRQLPRLTSGKPDRQELIRRLTPPA